MPLQLWLSVAQIGWLSGQTVPGMLQEVGHITEEVWLYFMDNVYFCQILTDFLIVQSFRTIRE